MTDYKLELAKLHLGCGCSCVMLQVSKFYIKGPNSSFQTLPLCGDKELNLGKESARLLSQLSQLSFEELEGEWWKQKKT